MEPQVIGDLPLGGHKWHGGNVGPDGNIYGIPCHADTVLKIDTHNGVVSEIGGPIPAGKHRPDGKYKYLGGVVSLGFRFFSKSISEVPFSTAKAR